MQFGQMEPVISQFSCYLLQRVLGWLQLNDEESNEITQRMGLNAGPNTCIYGACCRTHYSSAAPTSIDVELKPFDSVSESDYGNYAIWLWYSGEGGKAVPFTGKNDEGKFTAKVEVPEGQSSIGMLIRRAENGNDCAYQSQDVNIDAGKNLLVSVTETNESKNWQVSVTEKPGTDPDPSTDPGVTDPQGQHAVSIILHYVRYTGSFEGWNVWTWLPNQDGHSEALENGTATWTMTSTDPIEKVGLILRRSTPDNDWAEKNSPDDLFISNLTDGKAEIWIAQGDPNVYYSEEDVPDTPDLSCLDLHSKEFNDKYYYDGELGAIYSPKSTIFRLWAPTAQDVQLVN